MERMVFRWLKTSPESCRSVDALQRSVLTVRKRLVRLYARL